MIRTFEVKSLLDLQNHVPPMTTVIVGAFPAGDRVPSFTSYPGNVLEVLLERISNPETFLFGVFLSSYPVPAVFRKPSREL